MSNSVAYVELEIERMKSINTKKPNRLDELRKKPFKFYGGN